MKLNNYQFIDNRDGKVVFRLNTLHKKSRKQIKLAYWDWCEVTGNTRMLSKHLELYRRENE